MSANHTAAARAAILTTVLACAVSACVPATQPPPRIAPARPVPRPAPPPPPPAADWRDRQQTPGDWTWQRNPQTGSSEADFGDPQAVAISCVSPGKVRLAVQGRTGALTVRTTALDRKVAPSDQQVVLRPLPRTVIDFRANDPILDAMAFSRGRFALEFVGEAPLYLPSWPEISRVIEDCR